MRADLADLKCVCDEIARVIEGAESSTIAESNAIFLLQGDIGAGKTTLVKAFARYVGIKESVTSPTFSLLHIYGSLNSSLGASCGDFGNLGRFADSSPVSHPKFPKNSTTSTANTRICDLDSANQAQIAESTLDSANSQNLGENISSLRDSAKQNRGNPPCEKMQKSQGVLPRRFCEPARNDEFLDSSPTAQNDNFINSAESQNLTLYHYDLFNRNLCELLDLGLLDLLGENGIHFVEWGDERLFDIIKNAFENIFIIQITKAKNDRIYEFKSEF